MLRSGSALLLALATMLVSSTAVCCRAATTHSTQAMLPPMHGMPLVYYGRPME